MPKENVYVQDATFPTANAMVQVNEPCSFDVFCKILSEIADTI